MQKLFAVIFIVPLFAAAQKNYVAAFNGYIQSQVKATEFSGTVLVAQKGKIIFHKAFGLANREWGVANTLQSKYRIASITKQFTAAAILQLAEKGSLSLDDKLSKYFPAFPKGDSVTIHMLLNHTSGIKSYTNLPNFTSIAALPYAKDSVLALVINQPYEFAPGTRYNYNNSAYFLLGYIIEKVSGKSYAAFLDENLFKKTGLNNTFVNVLDSVLANRVNGYNKTPQGWKNAEYISMEFPYSSGAIISTVEDIYRWQRALFAGQVVSPAMFKKMTTPYLEHYGYGLVIDSFRSHRRIGHTGGIPGFSTYAVRYPDEEIDIIVLSNGGATAYSIATGLAAILLGYPVVGPFQHKAVAVNANILARYTGVYQHTDQATDTLLLKDGKLYTHHGNFRSQLMPESETTFFVADYPDYYFHFKVDKVGKVIKSYFIEESGIKEELKRLSR